MGNDEKIYRLYQINNSLSNLRYQVTQLKAKVRDNISIDDEGYKEEKLNNIINDIDNTSYSITNYVIPSLKEQ